MPNLGSYKKSRKQEKNKKKLKTALKHVKTKTVLPKGQNLTDTNFKVKKIVIRDQVRPHEVDEILYQKKLNVSELIGRLSHHNSSIKTDALDGLKEIITKYSLDDLAMSHIQILQSVIKLVMDETALIRKSSCKILGQLLATIAPTKLTPFLESLNSYLLCGLTHIERGIREDSLALLDICLKNVPDMCRKHAWNLLAVCLDLISVRNVSARTLSLNLDSSQVVTKWRIGVLERIHALVNSLHQTAEAKLVPPDPMDVEFKPEDENRFTVYELCKFKNDLSVSILDVDDDSEREKSKENATVFLENIFTLLMDMFLEVCPIDKSTNDSSTTLSEDNRKLLKLIVGILQISWNLSEDWNDGKALEYLSRKFTSPLLRTLVHKRFPFACQSHGKNGDESTSINLSIARLTLTITSSKHWSPVVPFLKNCFRNEASPLDTPTFSDCVNRIFLRQEFSEAEYFLGKAVENCLQGKSQLNSPFFKLLGRIALDPKMKRFHELPVFQLWLASLPQKLAELPAGPYQMKIISDISVRGFPSFSKSLDDNIELILDRVPYVDVNDEAKNKIIKWQMATLLYRVQDWDRELVESLQPAIDNLYWGEGLTHYISDIISMKSVE